MLFRKSIVLAALALSIAVGASPLARAEVVDPNSYSQDQLRAMVDAWHDIKLLSEDGRMVRGVNDHPGKLLFVNMWANWCVNCLAEMASIKQLQDMIGPQNLEVALVSGPNDWERDKVFAKTRQLPFPRFVLYNNPLETQRKATLERNGKYTLPITVVFDRDGAFCFWQLGARNWAEPNTVKQFRKLCLNQG